jgi:protocatechuate 3,4-dioxygenase, beta subunit
MDRFEAALFRLMQLDQARAAKAMLALPHTLSKLSDPVCGNETVREGDNVLTKQYAGEPIGELLIVHGLMMDEDRRGVVDSFLALRANA